LNISKKCFELVKKHEGCKLKAYPDPGTGGSPWTIGYGSTFYEDGSQVQPNDFISQDKADALLAYYLNKTAASIQTWIRVEVTQNQLDALTSLAYNIGIGNFYNSSVLRNLNQGNVKEAGDAFLLWDKGGKPRRVLPGLVIRRNEELTLFNS
jgi:lysozyme